MDPDLPTRPDLTVEGALRVAVERFGISATEAAPLPSDRDQNFRLLDRDSGRRYVLKVSHRGEETETLDLQNRILEHLARAGFSLSRVLFSVDGEEIIEVSGKGGAVHPTRLLTWLPGDLLYRVNPQFPGLFQSLGAFLGGMDRALEDFSHPAQGRKLKWDLRRAGEVVESHLRFVEDPEMRRTLEAMAAVLLDRLDPLLPDLRSSVIHADANDHNVLVTELGPGMGPEDRSVVGLVDFGDAVRSHTVAEPAIAAAYAALGKQDPITVASHIVAGYNQAHPLREAEIAAVYPLMGLRLCVSVAISAHQKQREPGNEYLTVSEAPAWELLERLSEESPDYPHFLFRQACGLEPVPSAPQVVAWLEARGREASPIVSRAPAGDGAGESETDTLRAEGEASAPLDLGKAPLHIFDLSPASAEFGMTPDSEDLEGWTDLVFEKMEAVGAQVGIGRYDEPRRWYTSRTFQSPTDDRPEWRTVHLGIDLFLEAGAAVHAPFDAVVFSVANNEDFLDYGPTVILEHRAEEVPEDHGPAQEWGGDWSQGGPDPGLRFWTLYGHLADDVLERLEPGQKVARGEAFAHIGPYPTNGSWAPHLHFQVVTDLMGHERTFPGVTLPSQRALWTALSPDPNLILRIPDPDDGRHGAGGRRGYFRGPARAGVPSGVPLAYPWGRDRSRILEARKRHLGPTLSVAYREPLKIVQGKGQYLYDQEGQPYLDCVNNVPHVGHNHPRVVEAGQHQMALLNTNTRYLSDLLVEYVERLVATFPEPLSVAYLVCTGSEANELALRMARTHTGRQDVLVVDGAYHGNTSALVDMSPYKFDRPGGRGAPPWVHKTLMPDPYRGRFRSLPEEDPSPETEVDGIRIGGPPETPRGDFEYLPASELGAQYGGHVREVLQALESEGRGPAAFFCESMLGCGGQIVLPDGYMASAFEHVRAAGGVCVADEVQVGFGRAGTHFWAFESQGVVPDIVTLGKPMANGHPMAAVVTTPDIASSFATGMEYFNTFGGNPVSCAIGLAVLDVLEEEGLQESARAVGEHLLRGLRGLMGKHPLIGDVRGLGLYIGVELVEDRVTRCPAPSEASRVKERLRERRILLSTDGPDENVLKIKPPMVFTVQDADRLIAALDEILEEDGLTTPPIPRTEP